MELLEFFCASCRILVQAFNLCKQSLCIKIFRTLFFNFFNVKFLHTTYVSQILNCIPINFFHAFLLNRKYISFQCSSKERVRNNGIQVPWEADAFVSSSLVYIITIKVLKLFLNDTYEVKQ